MRIFRRSLILALTVWAPLTEAQTPATDLAALKCGGTFQIFLADFTADALAQGVPPAKVEAYLAQAREDRAVLWADRKQSVFRKPFVEYAAVTVTAENIARGRQLLLDRKEVLGTAGRKYGVPPALLLALWGIENQFGEAQGSFNTRNALLTLAHDCRRAEVYRPEAMAALQLFALDRLAAEQRGSWTGGIGLSRLVATDILALGQDGDGDGKVTPEASEADLLVSSAAILAAKGWQANEPWLAEVVVPETFDWALSGRQNPMPVTQWAALGVAPRQGSSLAEAPSAVLVLPQGRKGPAFLAYPNFDILEAWLGDRTQALSLAYFATRIAGAETMRRGNPEPQLSREDLQSLQRKLVEQGHQIARLDGVLREDSRFAVQKLQESLGLPADGWPTLTLLEML